MRLRPLPDHVLVGAHSRLALAEVGVRHGELAGPLWRRVGRDAYAWAGTDPDACRQRVLEAAEQLPSGCAITGWAAAWLLGARDLDGLGRDGSTPQPVPLVVLPGARARRAGLTTIRSALADEEVQLVEGVPVTRPARTCFELMRSRAGLEDAVVGVDAMLRHDLLSEDLLHREVRRRRGWKRVVQARQALTLADGRARSAPESRLRVVWIVEAGLPRPLVNRAVYRTDGFPLGEPDLLDEESGLAGEYDGSGHRGLERHTHDNQREEWMEHAGLVVTRATSIDLGPRRRGLVGRLRAAHARAMARDASTRRWRLEGLHWR